jgi:type IV pilus assembly protein PilA
MASYKLAVVDCFNSSADLTQCDIGVNGVPAAPSNGTKAFKTLTVADGVITATPNDYKGILTAETCVLTPTAESGRLLWQYSGACVTKNYVKS